MRTQENRHFSRPTPAGRRMTGLRLIGLVAASLLLLAAGGKAPPAAANDRDWQADCPDAAGDGPRFCTVTARTGFFDNRGVAQRVGLVLHVDVGRPYSGQSAGGCISLHVELPAAVDEGRAAWLVVEDGAPQFFYRPAELKDLANALDDSRPPAQSVAPELAGFWREVQAGAVGGREAATAELVARFARLKQGRKLGIGCEATARLMPALLAGAVLRIGFATAPKRAEEPYHWAVRERREVMVKLDDLQPALDSLPRLR